MSGKLPNGTGVDLKRTRVIPLAIYQLHLTYVFISMCEAFNAKINI